MDEIDEAYKKAFVKFVTLELPNALKIIDQHTKAMDNLARQIRLMPTSVKVRY